MESSMSQSEICGLTPKAAFGGMSNITAMSLRTQRSMKHLQNLKNGHNYPKFLIGKLK
jgi:hypothetical protein